MTDQSKPTEGTSRQGLTQQAYHRRQVERGLTRLSVYVPEEGKHEFRAALEGLRASWKRRGLLQ